MNGLPDQPWHAVALALREQGATIEQVCGAVDRSETAVKNLLYPNTRAAARARSLRCYHANKHRRPSRRKK